EFAEGTYQDAQRIAASIAHTLETSLAQTAGSDLSRAGESGETLTNKSGPAGGVQSRWLQSCGLRAAAKNALLPYAIQPSLAELDALILECETRINDAGEGAAAAQTPQTPRAPQGVAALHGAPAPKAQNFAATHGAPLLEAQSFLAWARRIKRQCFDAQGRYKGPRATRARFGLLSLGEEFQLFAVPGELFCRIGMGLKKRALPAKLLVCGYYGGTVGYIPSEEACSQGGYEVESAYRYYGAPAALSPDTEQRIHAIVEALRREVAR
ncbi:MAG: hypothetical protein RBT73_11520, partial [Spirochaetia bacterium]|nr:hypothetical protein [Spirochaetia bacterium]